MIKKTWLFLWVALISTPLALAGGESCKTADQAKACPVAADKCCSVAKDKACCAEQGKVACAEKKSCPATTQTSKKAKSSKAAKKPGKTKTVAKN
jgi:hypothetical protein